VPGMGERGGRDDGCGEGEGGNDTNAHGVSPNASERRFFMQRGPDKSKPARIGTFDPCP